MTEFDATINGILVCTQQSLSSSVKDVYKRQVILPLAKQLLREVDYEHHPIRLIGLSVSNPREAVSYTHLIGSAVYLIQRYRREKYAEVSGEELDTPHPAGGLSGKRVRCV